MAAILKAVSDLNVSPFEAAMGRMDRRVDRFTKGNLAQLGRMIGGAFSVAAVTRFGAEVMKAADHIDNLASATGASYGNLQTLERLFEENGRAASEVGQILGRLKKNLDEAVRNPEYAKNIRDLGLSFEEVNNLGADRTFERISRALKENAGDAVMGEAAGNLLGRSYAELQGVMQELGTTGLDSLHKKFTDLNLIMGDEAVAAANRLEEQLSRLKRGLFTFWGGGMMTVIQSIQAGAAGLATGFDPQVMAEVAFGPTAKFDPDKAMADAKRRKASAEAMQATLDKRRNDAIAAANKWFAQSADKLTVGNMSAADDLARMGGYVGGQTSPAAAIAERQLKIAELQKQLTEKIAKATETTAQYTQQTAEALEE